MTGPQFFETRMGRIFYERDVPALVKALERIGDLLERVAEAKVTRTQPRPEVQADTGDPGATGGQQG